MEKYLVDAPPLRQSRPSDYRCDATTEHDDDDDDVGGGGGGRVTPVVHVHDLASLRPGTATLPDIKPLGSISDGKHRRLSQLFISVCLLVIICAIHRSEA